MAYTFNGTNQYLSTMASPLGAGQLGDFSISLWVNGAAASPATNFFTISRSTETSGVNNPSIILQNTNGAFTFFIRANSSPSGNSWNSSTGGVSAGENQGGTAFNSAWHHVCATLLSTTSTLYVDGTSVATYTASSVPTQTGMDRLGIGAFVRGNVVTYYSGKVADVGVYSSALSAQEVASLSKGVSCRIIRPQSLVFYSQLIRDIIDIKNQLTITNNNAATVSDHPRIYY